MKRLEKRWNFYVGSQTSLEVNYNREKYKHVRKMRDWINQFDRSFLSCKEERYVHNNMLFKSLVFSCSEEITDKESIRLRELIDKLILEVCRVERGKQEIVLQRIIQSMVEIQCDYLLRKSKRLEKQMEQVDKSLKEIKEVKQVKKEETATTTPKTNGQGFFKPIAPSAAIVAVLAASVGIIVGV